MNTLYTKIIDDKKVIKSRKNIILKRDRIVENPETGEMENVTMQTFNPTEEMLFEDG